MQHGAAFCFGLLFFVHDSVGSAEIDGHFLELLDAAPGTDGLIVYLYLADLVVLIEHFGIEWVRKSRSSASQFFDPFGGAAGGCGSYTDKQPKSQNH